MNFLISWHIVALLVGFLRPSGVGPSAQVPEFGRPEGSVRNSGDDLELVPRVKAAFGSFNAATVCLSGAVVKAFREAGYVG